MSARCHYWIKKNCSRHTTTDLSLYKIRREATVISFHVIFPEIVTIVHNTLAVNVTRNVVCNTKSHLIISLRNDSASDLMSNLGSLVFKVGKFPRAIFITMCRADVCYWFKLEKCRCLLPVWPCANLVMQDDAKRLIIT